MRMICKVLNDPALLGAVRNAVTPHAAREDFYAYVDAKCDPVNQILGAVKADMGNDAVSGFMFAFTFIRCAGDLFATVGSEVRFATDRFADRTWTLEQLRLLVRDREMYIRGAENILEAMLIEFAAIIRMISATWSRSTATRFRAGILICLALFVAACKEFY